MAEDGTPEQAIVRDALAALAIALTRSSSQGGQRQPGEVLVGLVAGPRAIAGMPPADTAVPLPTAEKRVFGAELHKALSVQAGQSGNETEPVMRGNWVRTIRSPNTERRHATPGGRP